MRKEKEVVFICYAFEYSIFDTYCVALCTLCRCDVGVVAEKVYVD